MLHKTSGICIHHIKYKETSIIAKIYTQEFGLQSYIINSVRTAKPKYSIALFQTFTLLDMVVYHKEGNEMLQRVSEVRCIKPFQRISSDFIKTSIVVFLSEILLKTLRTEEKNERLYVFLTQALHSLDSQEQVENFPIVFLLELLEHLGLLGKDCSVIFAQLHEVSALKVPASHFQSETKILQDIQSHRFAVPPIPMPTRLRKDLLNYILLYYRLQFDFFGEVKSLQILRNL